MEFILASNNKGKLKEIKEKLKKFRIDVISQSEAGINIEVNETGTTYEENATLKAKAIYDLTHKPVISDDSGLEIDFLDGKPGIFSARFLGEDTPYEEKRNKVLEMLKNASEEERTARFRCSICFIDEKGNTHIFSEKCEGIIAHSSRGTNGFGYDPIFEYKGKTFAELTQEEKSKVSHRGKAINKFVEYIATNRNV